jgi:hypothetical protein
MGQATRTTKLYLQLSKRDQGGANTDKQAALRATVEVLNRARAFYIDFFLAHADKLAERVPYYSQKHLELRERAISAHELLSWVEACTVATKAHPHPWEGWNFSQAFPGMPFIYRRSVIKDAIGKVRAFLSNRAHWEKSGKKKGRPGWPGAANHPTLYEGAFSLELDGLDQRASFVRLKVYTGQTWMWVNYPVKYSRYFEQRRAEPGWEQQSPKLVLGKHTAQLHFSQTKEISAKKITESKLDPHLVTVAVDLNVKNLAVITVRQQSQIIETVFVTDHGLDAHRYRHLKRIAKKQAYALGVVTAEVNPHGTSQYCSCCGARGERFSCRGGRRMPEKGGKLFRCYVCHYEANADFNGSANVHHSFYREWHWQLQLMRSG